MKIVLSPWEHYDRLHAVRGRSSVPALTKEVVHPPANVRPGHRGALVLRLRGAPGQEIVVVRVGRAGSRVRAPSSNIHVFAQVTVTVAARTVVEDVIARHPIVHQPGQLVLLVRSLSARRIRQDTVTMMVVVTTYMSPVLAPTLAATQVINVNVNVSSSAGAISGIHFRINDELCRAVIACSDVVVIGIRHEEALVLVLVRR